MPEPALARRYAHALYATAGKKGAIDAVDQDIAAVADLLQKNRDLRNFLHSPRVLASRKVGMVKSVFGSRIQPLTVHFLLLLLDKKRFDLIEDVAGAYGLLADDFRGVLRASVRTPTAMSEPQVALLKSKLEAITSKHVKLAHELDPEMIGGISVVVGDHLLDGSIRAGLDRLRDQLRSVSVV